MDRIVNAIEKDLASGNYYSSLYVALSLIDACAKIEYPTVPQNNQRYTTWLNSFYLPLYERDIANPMIPANGIYQLRCSVLHESTSYIDKKSRIKFQDISNLYRFILTTTPSHRNSGTVSDGKETIQEIQINVGDFVREIVESIKQWMGKHTAEEYGLRFSIDSDKWSSTELGGATAFKDNK